MSQVEPKPPHAAFALPWDDPAAPPPVEALRAARAELGDTFTVSSGTDVYLFVFSPDALRAFYALPEAAASKGLADYRMLLRKLPPEVFAGRRTFAHDLFGAQETEGYLDALDAALALQLDELGAAGRFDVFALSRRIGHRLGLACWVGLGAASGAAFDAFVAELDVLDAAEAFVRPASVAERDGAYRAERAAIERYQALLGDQLAAPKGFLAQIAERWSDVAGEEARRGIALDVLLLHTATMTNLFAGLGWALVDRLLQPAFAGRERDVKFLERAALESVRLAQRSIMMRQVLRAIELSDGRTAYRVLPGTIVATMLPLTNATAARGFDRFDPERWDGRRLRDEDALAAREEVVTFGHGRHACPAQRFSLSVVVRTLRALDERFVLEPRFSGAEPLLGQIGGISRAATPCPVDYRRR